MKYFMLRSLCTCLVFITSFCLQSTLLAQLPSGLDTRYAVERVVIPEPSLTNIDQVEQIRVDLTDPGNPSAIVVGVFSRINVSRVGFIYDHFGTIDPFQPKRFYALDELPGGSYPPAWAGPTFTSSKIFGLNSSGRVTGYLRDPVTNETLAFYLDINDPNLEIKEIPRPADGVVPDSWFSGSEVNEVGQIIVRYALDNSTFERVFVFDPTTGISTPVPVDIVDTPHAFNSLGDIFLRTNVDPVIIKRYNYLSGTIEVIPGDSLSRIEASNDAGQFVGSRRVTDRKGRNKGENGDYVTRYGSNFDVEFDGRARRAYSLNLAGDFSFDISSGPFQTSDPLPNEVFVFQDEWVEMALVDLVLDADPQNPNDPSDVLANCQFLNDPRLSDRDSTGFGWMACSGMAAGAELEQELFLLIPFVPGQTPGITVTPTQGLFTTEAFEGAPASFEVVLNTQPTADVTIGISSNDPTEGTTDKTSLTFTQANWSDAQTVIVTGVDDEDIDRNIAYTILTAAASSTDPDYNGIDPDDVEVTNLDDEQAPTVTYDSDDTPTAILDPGMTDSTITTEDDFQIANMIVTLNISHQRSSDLSVYLVGANDQVVQLFNFNGDNDVADFNGNSTTGSWTLQIYDNRKKRTGDLNSWSMIVETN